VGASSAEPAGTDLAAEPAEDRASGSGYLQRQRLLLDEMLRVTLEQRRHLIEGNLEGLNASNQLLARLLDRQADLRRQLPTLAGGPQPSALAPGRELHPRLLGRGGTARERSALAELRRLAEELRAASRTNYLLACRGAQFADFSLSLIERAQADSEVGPDAKPRGALAVDTRR